MMTVFDTEEERVLESIRKRSVVYRSLERMYKILEYLAENKIEPNSNEGKHASIDLQSFIDEFNNAFIEKGLNPNLKMNFDLC